MSVICFSSLKGGVGKTSLSLNVGHAFAENGKKTLCIDLDPAAHASRYFQNDSIESFGASSPLAQLFLSQDISDNIGNNGTGNNAVESNRNNNHVLEAIARQVYEYIVPVRKNYDLLKAGSELRHFYWGKGAQAFRKLFPPFIQHLRKNYDNIVIDTAPDFSVLLRNAVAVSDMVVIPVDASAMSIDCLEELFNYCNHITKPVWGIVRTMVNNSALKVQALSNFRIKQKLQISAGLDEGANEIDDRHTHVASNGFIEENPLDFMTVLNERRKSREVPTSEFPMFGCDGTDFVTEDATWRNKPIYLLNSLVNRTENQNRLSFMRKTAFDLRDTAKLAGQYAIIAEEIEGLISYVEENTAKNNQVEERFEAVKSYAV